MNDKYIEIDGKFYQKAEVIMLPTNKPTVKGNILLSERTNSIELSYMEGDTKWLKPQHLYITSTEKIKESDWCINTGGNINHSFPFRVTKDVLNNTFIKKIIATTDSELQYLQDKTKCIADLIIENKVFLPKLSNSFIKKFASEYNKKNVISGGLVEVNKKKECSCYYTKFCQSTMLDDDTYCRDWEKERYGLKVAKDNTITIKPLVVDKLEQLANLLKKYDVRKYLNINDFGYSLVEREIVKLFEKNL